MRTVCAAIVAQIKKTRNEFRDWLIIPIKDLIHAI